MGWSKKIWPFRPSIIIYHGNGCGDDLRPTAFQPAFGLFGQVSAIRPVAEGQRFFRPLAERLAEMIFFFGQVLVQKSIFTTLGEHTIEEEATTEMNVIKNWIRLMNILSACLKFLSSPRFDFIVSYS